MSANDKQVGGQHYRGSAVQHWDWAAAEGLDYFQGAITKYVARWKKKNGLQDLEKAQHYLEKYIELVKAGVVPTDGPLPQQTKGTTVDAPVEKPAEEVCVCLHPRTEHDVNGDQGCLHATSGGYCACDTFRKK